MLLLGENWQPSRIDRVIRVINTSTKPLFAATDQGTALVKYMGNKAGLDALVTELICAKLANMIGLSTPDFAVVDIPSIPTPDPFVTVEPGPAFFSRWERAQPLSPNSKLLENLRYPHQVAALVTFDTWVRNKDRFSSDHNDSYENTNYDNILFKPDKKKSRLLVIDHSHAFTESTLEDEINDGWVNERAVYGLFDEFKPTLKRKDVQSALLSIGSLDIGTLRQVCDCVPPQWGMTNSLADRMSKCLEARGKHMLDWLPDMLFDQLEFKLERKEG